VPVKGVALREMKTRWGSGGNDGVLRFNWRIVMAPRRLVEYVVAHEQCHLRYHDHSQQFWRLLARVIPDFQERRQELERLGPSLDLR
jgi:predicted metal-dependent hydrolase